MTLMNTLARLGRNLLGLDERSIPKETIVVKASAMADKLAEEGTGAWNGYRLVGFGDSYSVDLVHGDWKTIAAVEYLAVGEGDAPTIYIIADDDQEGSYPCHLGENVLLLPPGDEVAA